MRAVTKDDRLAFLARSHNVAQFVSFASGDLRQRRSVVSSYDLDHRFSGPRDAVEALFRAARPTQVKGVPAPRSVNVRSFRVGQERGNPFEYGLTRVDEVMALLRSLASSGLHVIVNETIDIRDGGVSGVAQSGVMEFVPQDTPRGVEEPGAVSLPFDLGKDLLSMVYGFVPDVAPAAGERLEFSIHPIRTGYRHSHTVLWETSSEHENLLSPAISWPNKFSQFIGDKAYGLLMSHLLRLPVPRTTVVGRNVSPFSFGIATGTGETWMRTCPKVPEPGLHPTTYGWVDPFGLLAGYHLDASAVVSVLAQDAVDACFSGSTAPADDGGADLVQGVRGHGDQYMLGERSPDDLPDQVVSDVRALLGRAGSVLGAVRAEFVHDGTQPWVVQLHLVHEKTESGVVNSGRPENGWLDFDPGDGLNRLRTLIAKAQCRGLGVRVTAPVGVTSHVGELLRMSGVPARISAVKTPLGSG